ncbi:LANO_0G01068g1_1 [Lachancea nothofagi CBS 11611]|uniref:LANO_0G01068g1_1 n=1 Tax=Lachancea nothofagi CBS 11611 TaxID=1266666 RepID=A0A1G4KEH2_9SACH|nr:LANO_0G01068g1_1 [Lachancea nothofagi CBS 11611]
MSEPVDIAPPVVVESPAEEDQIVKQPVLSPAPVPTTSPWKAVPVVSSTPIQQSNGSSKWPSAHEAVGKLEKRDKPAAQAPVVKSTGKEKWVPMKASIVVSGSKKFGSTSNGSSVGSNAGARKGQAGKKPRRTASTTGAATARTKKSSPVAKEDAKQDSSSGSQVAVDDESRDSDADFGSTDVVAPADVDNASENLSTEVSKSSELSQAQSGNDSDHSSNIHQQNTDGFQRGAQVQGQNNGYPRRRFNQGHHGDNNGSFKPHQPHSQYPAKQAYGSFRHQQTNRPFSPGYRQKSNQRNGPNGFYNPQPPHPFVAVNNIARQIEYYFSIENLTKDEYLRSQLNAEGFAPLSLITKFYRIVNMSFGGDESLIMGALREIVANENATVDVAELEQDEIENNVAKYLVRSKSWQQWVTKDEAQQTTEPESSNQKILANDDLDSFRIQPPVFESSPMEHQHSNTEQNTETEE